MKFLPIDIRQKSFAKKAIGGFNPTEVKIFLNNLSEEWLQITLNNKELERQVAFLREELDKVRSLESQLMQQCERTAHLEKETIQKAEKESRLKVMRAEIEAQAMMDTAKHKAAKLLAKVKSECELQMHGMKFEFEVLNDSFKEVEDHSDVMVKEMKDFVETTQQKLATVATLKANKLTEEKLKSAQNLLRATFAHTSIELNKMMERNGLLEDRPTVQFPSEVEHETIVESKHTVVARQPDTTAHSGSPDSSQSVYDALKQKANEGKPNLLDILNKKKKG